MTVMQRLFWFIAILGNPAATGLAWFIDDGFWVLEGVVALYTLIGLYDLFFSPHTLNRLYPVAAYIRYMLEFIRPEIHQYFIASNTDERPFNRELRSLVYQRAKGVRDTKAFGTERDITESGYLFAFHSMQPTAVIPEKVRITVGGDQCTQPYSASRLNVSAMSFGAISANAVRALNKGAKLGNFYHNTGEGGLSPYHLEFGGDIVWQIGTGCFGCRTEDGKFDPEKFKVAAAHPQVKMIEIKISQGAKPSHGGILPGIKVTAEIAKIRGVKPGETCASPPTHPSFSSPRELLAYVQQLRELSDGKPIGFKLCVGAKHEFLGICKAMLETGILPDFITVDGAEGGTGAAPVEFTNRMGLPCLEGVFFVHNSLVGINLRDKIRIIASGKTATGFDVLLKMALGADLVNAARTMMFALGCVQSQACNTNRCPTGVATQDPIRGKGLNVEQKHRRVANFQEHTVSSFLELLEAMGVDDPAKLSPHHIKRRVSDHTAQPLDELYPILQQGELLGTDINPRFKRIWEIATPDQFVPAEVWAWSDKMCR